MTHRTSGSILCRLRICLRQIAIQNDFSQRVHQRGMMYNEEDLVKRGNGRCVEKLSPPVSSSPTQNSHPIKEKAALNSGGLLLHPAACLASCSSLGVHLDHRCSSGNGRPSQHYRWARTGEGVCDAKIPPLELSQTLLWILPCWGHSSVAGGSHCSQR